MFSRIPLDLQTPIFDRRRASRKVPNKRKPTRPAGISPISSGKPGQHATTPSKDKTGPYWCAKNDS